MAASSELAALTSGVACASPGSIEAAREPQQGVVNGDESSLFEVPRGHNWCRVNGICAAVAFSALFFGGRQLSAETLASFVLSRSVATSLTTRETVNSTVRVAHESAGILRNKEYPDQCLDVEMPSWLLLRWAVTKGGVAVVLDRCRESKNGENKLQQFQLTDDGELQHLATKMCIGIQLIGSDFMRFLLGDSYAILQSCGGIRRERWEFTDVGLLRNERSGDCIKAVSPSALVHANKISLGPCVDDERPQSHELEPRWAEGAQWFFFSVRSDLSSTGFIRHVLSRKCFGSNSGGLALAECEFWEAGAGQLWRMTSSGTLENRMTGECLDVYVAAGRGRLVTQPCGRKSQRWTFDGQQVLRGSREGGCLEPQDGAAQCNGQTVVLKSCGAEDDSTGVRLGSKWKFLPVAQVPARPVGSPEQHLPDKVASLAIGVQAVLVKAGFECLSKDTSLGSHRTLGECMLAAHRSHALYFIFGTRGIRRGWCYAEFTTDASCPEGWKRSDYNFYRVTLLEDAGWLGAPGVHLQMGELAGVAYGSVGGVGTTVAGWTLARSCDKRRWPERNASSQRSRSLFELIGQDFMHIFTRGDSCVLAFAGTNDVHDAIADVRGAVPTQRACGVDMHGGFLGELRGFLHASCWAKEFAPLLASPACAGGRIVVGHSLGGAIASTLAFCANIVGGGGWEEVLPQTHATTTNEGAANVEAVPTFTVTGLYTFGAPGVAKESLANGQSPDGCFPGARVFSVDSEMIDPVPWIASIVGLIHPRMDAFWLYEDYAGRVTKAKLPCGEGLGVTMPFTDMLCLPSVGLHDIHKYLYRIEQVF
eukprot:TRINITY_DN60711_c0_g1_i1.p1 TRINITY_DN60711_c0_g1~~TRINITY_DN60711_c0_g1_i1.p1  ORF type:complete len:844 (-),score=103.89 TRINITY_DN60711_c0_g1_i1:111-2570(-)